MAYFVACYLLLCLYSFAVVIIVMVFCALTSDIYIYIYKYIVFLCLCVLCCCCWFLLSERSIQLDSKCHGKVTIPTTIDSDATRWDRRRICSRKLIGLTNKCVFCTALFMYDIRCCLMLMLHLYLFPPYQTFVCTFLHLLIFQFVYTCLESLLILYFDCGFLIRFLFLFCPSFLCIHQCEFLFAANLYYDLRVRPIRRALPKFILILLVFWIFHAAIIEHKRTIFHIFVIFCL